MQKLDELVSQSDIERVDQLLEDLKRARAARAGLQPQLDQLYEAAEMAAQKVVALQLSETPPDRQHMTQKQLLQAQRERDNAVAAADQPVKAIERQIREIIDPILSNLRGYLAFFASTNSGIDPKLDTFAAQARKQLAGMTFAGLRQILIVFEEAQGRLEAWPVPDACVEVSKLGRQRRKMLLPRPGDWFLPPVPRLPPEKD